MENDKHYFSVGLFVLLGVLAILGFAIWIGSEGKGDFARYRVRFAESVSGLSVGGAVKYRGVDVGSVESITIDQKDTNLIEIIIKVAEDTPIKTDTVASLKLQGITGVVFIELAGGTNEAQNLIDTVKKNEIPEIKSKSSPLSAIVDRMPELVDRVSAGIEQINALLSNENISNIKKVISNFNETSAILADDMQALKPMIDNGNATAANLREITQNSKTAVNETVENLNRSSKQLDSLIRDLRKTSHHVSNLAETVDEDPSSLIFGKKEKGVPLP